MTRAVFVLRLRRLTIFFAGVAIAARVLGNIAIATVSAVVIVSVAFALFIIAYLEAPR